MSYSLGRPLMPEQVTVCSRQARSVLYLIRNLFPNAALLTYVLELRRALRGCRTVLDVGCGSFSMLPFLDLEFTVGVDAYAPSLAMARRRRAHNALDQSDVRDIGKRYASRSFDACVALDVIEHLPKGDGYTLLQDMETIAARKVVVVTPNGFVEQAKETLEAFAEGDYQQHRSGWDTVEMRRLGFVVSGLYGAKELRGPGGRLRFRPRIFMGVLSELTHYLCTRTHSERAAELLCVKDINT